MTAYLLLLLKIDTPSYYVLSIQIQSTALPYYEISRPGRLGPLFPGHSIEPGFAFWKNTCQNHLPTIPIVSENPIKTINNHKKG